MSTTTFSLADLVPDPLIFSDRDDARYEVLSAEQISEADYARLGRIQREIQDLQRLAEAADDPTNALAALRRCFNQIISLLVPTMPEARVAALTIQEKTAFMTWWRTQQPQPSGEATAGLPTGPQRRRRKRRSRG